MYWFALFADAVTDTPMDGHVVRHTVAFGRTVLMDAQGAILASWDGVSRRQGRARARDWLADQTVARGQNPLHDDLYYAQRQGLA